MHGDMVVVRIGRMDANGRGDGEIIKVLKRAHPAVVGEFRTGRHGSYVIPFDQKLTAWIDIVEGIRRLTSHPADLYGIRNRGRLVVGAQADMLLFDPATVGISPAERVADLPGGGRRSIRRPTGVHGVFCNGVRTFDGRDYVKHAKGPGHVLDRFNSSQGSHSAIAAQ